MLHQQLFAVYVASPSEMPPKKKGGPKGGPASHADVAAFMAMMDQMKTAEAASRKREETETRRNAYRPKKPVPPVGRFVITWAIEDTGQAMGEFWAPEPILFNVVGTLWHDIDDDELPAPEADAAVDASPQVCAVCGAAG